MALNITTLRSSSKGNCSFVTDGKTQILIDCGVSFKQIKEALFNLEQDISDIDAVVITHEHSDHTKGIGVLSRNTDIPIFANKETWQRMYMSYDGIKDNSIKVHRSKFAIGDIEITPFKISHDAVNPVGYAFVKGTEKVAYLTDSGTITPEIESAVNGARQIVLESNHDLVMLKNGIYPQQLKNRILGNKGHLSNDSAGEFAQRLLASGTEKFILGHLSPENNLPSIARSSFLLYMDKISAKEGKDFSVSVAPANEPSHIKNTIR